MQLKSDTGKAIASCNSVGDRGDCVGVGGSFVVTLT